MTRPLTKYEANDGTLFDSERDAFARDLLLLRLDAIEAPLGPRVPNSGEWKQHPWNVYVQFKTSLVELCRELYPKESVFQFEPMTISPFSFSGRFLDDAAPRCVNALWHRLMCISDLGTEYEQPYYVLHPEEVTR